MVEVMDLIPEIYPSLGAHCWNDSTRFQAPAGMVCFFESMPGPQISDYGRDKVFGELFLGWYSQPHSWKLSLLLWCFLGSCLEVHAV